MKHQTDLNNLNVFLKNLNSPLSRRQYEQMCLYYDLLNRWSGKLNLVSRNDIAHLVERHFLPSVYLTACLPKDIKGTLLDLGSGAGFPGVVVAIMRPDLEVTLLDSSRKKTLFLEEIGEEIGLNVQIVCQRCEQYTQTVNKKFKIIVSRAVAKLDVLLKWTDGLLDRHGFLYAFKGGKNIDELEETKQVSGKYRIFKPGDEWIDFSNYMQNKFIIRVER